MSKRCRIKNVHTRAGLEVLNAPLGDCSMLDVVKALLMITPRKGSVQGQFWEAAWPECKMRRWNDVSDSDLRVTWYLASGNYFRSPNNNNNLC